MRGRRAFRLVGIGVVALGIALAGAFGLRALGSGAADKAAGEPSLAAAIQTKQVDGQTHLLVPQEALAAGDIAVEPLKAIEFQERVAALATVASPQTLLDQRRAYQTATAEAARGELATRTARVEVQRLQRLHRDNRIVSDKAVETAEVQAATEETNSRLAGSQLSLQGAALGQQWGPVLSDWLVKGSPRLDRLLSGQDFLVQVSLPTGRYLADPSMAQLELPSGERFDAAIVSGVPQADPKFQAQGFYAIVPASARLLPGMTVSASVPVGAPIAGVEVPDDALVRWQGKAYAFIEAAEGEFVRQLIPTETATPNGWLVRSGLPVGVGGVVRGAQLLLSEELKVHSIGDESR